MDRGFIKLWRKSQESRVFQNADLWKVWTWCLMRANHKEEWVTLKTGKGDIDVFVEPGEFVFGRHSAAKKLKMKPSSVRNRIKKLENMQNLTIQQDNQYSIISVCNWGLYQPKKIEIGQEEGQPKDRQRTTKGQAKDTEKNDKNYKNEEKEETILLDGSQNQVPYQEIIIYLNEKTGRSFKYTTPETKTLIKARWNQNFTLKDFQKVIDNKTKDWLTHHKYSKYLRPQTLFGTKFESYLNEKHHPLEGVVGEKTIRTIENLKDLELK